MEKNKKKILSIALDVIVMLLITLIVWISISAIISKDKGYTMLFGKAVYAAKTDSMKSPGRLVDENGNPYPCATGFDKDALILSTVLKTPEEKKSLKVGEVITFFVIINGQKELNTHRIVDIINEGGANHSYITRGDKQGAPLDPDAVIWSEVIAVYDGKIEGLGAVVNFTKSSVGFFAIVVIPSFMILIYAIYSFTMAIKKVKYEEDKRLLKEQLLAELKRESEAHTE